jgi:hypothetical protein
MPVPPMPVKWTDLISVENIFDNNVEIETAKKE